MIDGGDNVLLGFVELVDHIEHTATRPCHRRIGLPGPAIPSDVLHRRVRVSAPIVAAVAQFERELIREHTIAGIRVAQANGKHVGRPKRVFRRDEVVRLRERGESWRSKAAKLGIPVMTAVDAYRDGCTENLVETAWAAD